MELFALDSRIEQLEALVQADGSDPEPRLELAWQLRQRDPQRALALCAQLTNCPSPYVPLIRAERCLYGGELELARDWLEKARPLTVDDSCAAGDLAWIESYVDFQLGRPDAVLANLQRACAAYRVCGDAIRLRACESCEIGIGLLLYPERVEALADSGPPTDPPLSLPSLWQDFVRGHVNFLRGRQGLAAAANLRAEHAARVLGDIHLAAACSLNAAECFSDLQDLAGALEWAERGLRLAQQFGSLSRIAQAHTVLGGTLARLGRLDEAAQHLALALQRPVSLRNTHGHASTLAAHGELAAQRGDWVGALDWLQQAVAVVERHSWGAQLQPMLCSLARALARCAQTESALQRVDQAMALAESLGNRRWQISALQARAEVLDLCAGASDASRLCLQRALELAGGDPAAGASPELLEQAARAWAAAGDTRKAYDLAQAALRAQERRHSVHAEQRMVALRVRQEVEHLRAETEHQRQLHQEQLERNAMLDQLGQIGREISTRLEPEAVFQALHKQLELLMDCHFFVCFSLDPTLLRRDLVFGVEAGQRLVRGSSPVPPDHPLRDCIAQRRGIIIARFPVHLPTHTGGPPSRSALYAPLFAGERLLGVMSVQSLRENAFGERELALFETLCAYAATALHNADTVAALHLAQRHSAEQDRLAALGGLVANISHEINTPMGAIKSSAQMVQEALQSVLLDLPGLLRRIDETELRALQDLLPLLLRPQRSMNSRDERALVCALRSELNLRGYPQLSSRAGTLVQAGLQAEDMGRIEALLSGPNAAELLDALYRLRLSLASASNVLEAVDRVGRIVFTLRAYAGELQDSPEPLALSQSLESALARLQHRLQPGIELNRIYRAQPIVHAPAVELSHVWSQLILNALQAMPARQGRLTLRLDQRDGHAHVEIEDNGAGVAPDLVERIFEPFFSTKPKGEGSGLGLDIVRKLVTRMGGQVGFRSPPGQGACFEVRLPLRGA